MATEPNDKSWRLDAKCRGLDPNMFVPDGPGGSLDRAVAVCHGWDGRPPCPVRWECHQAGELNSEYGVWGGNIRGQRGVRVIPPITGIADGRPRRTS